MRKSRVIENVSVRDRQERGRMSLIEDVHGGAVWRGPRRPSRRRGNRLPDHSCFSNNDVLRLGYLIWKEDEKCHGEL